MVESSERQSWGLSPHERIPLPKFRGPYKEKEGILMVRMNTRGGKMVVSKLGCKE